MTRGTIGAVPLLDEVLVIALGAERVARAISTDEFSAPLRARLDRWAESSRPGPSGAPARLIAELAHCPVCTGWWASLALSAAWPGRRRVRRGVSVAGAQVLLTLLERLVSERGRASIHDADVSAARSRRLGA